MTTDSPVWLITGCSSGFGREFAKAALRHGFRVMATARHPDALAELAAGRNGQLHTAPLDVTRPEQIQTVVRETERLLGRIDVLVNNAGYGYMAAVEEGEDKAIRDQFETNFFGLAAMIRAVLPGMRARHKGAIVNIASVGGIMGFPASGYYAATKFAVEGLSESLAQEVEPLGIRILLVEPGPFRTDWAGRSLKQSAIQIADYEPTAGQRRKTIGARSGTQAGDPARAAEIIIKTLELPKPPLHLVLGQEGVTNVENHLKAQLAEVAQWKEISISADYSGAQP